jgi:hypothetical protein
LEEEPVPELKELLMASTETSLWIRATEAGGSRCCEVLKDREADGMKSENCPMYIREWMDRDKD